MKQLKALLARSGPQPVAGQKPVWSPWIAIHELVLKGGALQFTETRVIGLRGNDNYECHEILVPNGIYRVECRVARYGLDARIGGLRALPEGLDGMALTRGAMIKELPVDLGGISVVDIGAVQASMDEDEERYEEWTEAVLYGDSAEPVTIHTWKPTETAIPAVESGFGDGSYPLYPLYSGKQIVGLEVEFIGETAEYPM